MAISLRLTEAEEALIRRYAKLHGATVSDVMREAILEKIEDEFDLAAYEAAMADHAKDPITHTLAEAERALGLADV